MMQILDRSARFHSSKKSSPAFEPLAVHIDADLSHTPDESDTPARRLLSRHRQRFPNVSFECLHLSRIWTVKTIDWSSLSSVALHDPSISDPVERLRRFFEKLPSVSSRVDVLRLFVRHLLLHVAFERSYTAVLFGHTTTALAALTLTEVANGRGYAVSSLVNDGLYAVRTHGSATSSSHTEGLTEAQMPIYYPLREVFKNELTTYINLVPSLKELVPEPESSAGRVVSHKDLSIAEVVGRYFDDVEAPYSGIVANVVRTTGKLDRGAGQGFCHMCGMALDERGDALWAGELGDDGLGALDHNQPAGLCYGCKRTASG
ncbi:hypothetical protein UVI_02047940 [Ustilaginoidea virens]|nr:hypothetical protein UVI_02047940 [Ustilaginoidea virens]